MISPRAIEVGARTEAEHDGRGWEAMPRSDRERYQTRFAKAHEAALAAEGMVVVPASDLRVVVDLARQADSNLDTECIAEYLKDAAQPAEGEK